MPSDVRLPAELEGGRRRREGSVLWYNAETGNGQLRPKEGGDDIYFKRDEVTFMAAGEAPTPATALSTTMAAGWRPA